MKESFHTDHDVGKVGHTVQGHTSCINRSGALNPPVVASYTAFKHAYGL